MTTETEAIPAKININFDLVDPDLIERFLRYKKSTGLEVSNAQVARKVMSEGLNAIENPKRKARSK